MVDFGIFELIIALLAGYLGLGLVTSYLNDLISGLMGWRSKLLAVGIERMLGDAKLAGDILKHPLVASLANREGQSPSNMPPEVFTQALMELVAPGVAKVEVEHLQEYVTKLPDTLAKKTLKSILGGHLGDINGVREDVQKWIAHTNDILGALYGRRMIQTSLVVAAILTTFLGLDFFTVASYFLQKNVINASLTNAVSQNPQTALTLVQQSLPIGWNMLPQTSEDWLRKIVGLAISTIAVAVCASFTFNVRKILLPRIFYPPLNVKEPLENLRQAEKGDVQAIAASQILLLNEYQNQVLSQQNRSFLYALVAAAIGLGFFLTAITFLLLQQKSDAALVSALAGAIVEVISGINFYLYAQTTAQVDLFHARLDMTQRFLLANSVCDALKDNYKEEARSALVRAIVTAEPTTQPSPKPKDEKKEADRADN